MKTKAFVSGIAYLALAACAPNTPPPASLNVEPQTVYVDRPVACVPAGDVPQRPANLPARPADVRAAADLLYAKVLEWVGYGEKAEALLSACAK